MKLFLKTTLFTVVIPGTFAVLLAGDRTAASGATLGLALSSSRSAAACICALRGILPSLGEEPRTNRRAEAARHPWLEVDPEIRTGC